MVWTMTGLTRGGTSKLLLLFWKDNSDFYVRLLYVAGGVKGGSNKNQ